MRLDRTAGFPARRYGEAMRTELGRKVQRGESRSRDRPGGGEHGRDPGRVGCRELWQSALGGSIDLGRQWRALTSAGDGARGSVGVGSAHTVRRVSSSALRGDRTRRAQPTATAGFALVDVDTQNTQAVLFDRLRSR